MNIPLHFRAARRRASAFILVGSIAALLTTHLWAQTTITYTDGQTDATGHSISAPNNPTTLTIATGTATQSGLLSGTGTLLKTGPGRLILSGANTYVGPMQVTGGMLNIFNDANLGPAGNTVTLAGGTLQTSSTYSSHPLAISSASTIDTASGFTTLQNAALTGSGALTKTGGGIFFLAAGTGNTFSGDITVAVNGGTFQIGSSAPSGPPAGAALTSLTSANTITVNRGGTFNIQENDANGIRNGFLADRLGTAGNRPNIAVTGGTLNLNGANNAATMTQTLGALNVLSGASTINVTRNTAGTPELVFSSLNRTSGGFANFTGTALGTGINDGRILFNSAPALTGGGGLAGSPTISILPGARSGSELATYDATNGIRPLAAAEYNAVSGNDLNGAATTQNVKISNATPTAFPSLTLPRTINALVTSAAATATWAMGNTLTLTSGQFIHSSGSTLSITSGTLTAGTGAAGNIELEITTVTNTVTLGANVTNNGSTVVSLVKNGGTFPTLSLSSASDNTYSGGTVVNEGSLFTGPTANRRYLGTGAVVVNSSGSLTMNAPGATSFSGSAGTPTYTVRTGGAVLLAGVAPAGNEFFKLESGAILGTGGVGAAAGLDLNTNVNAGAGAILAESTAGNNVAIKKGGVAIQTALTTPTYYFGIGAANLQENINVGTGTPWLGISTDRSARSYGGVSSTNNTITANGDFALQGFSIPGASASSLTLGGGSSATNIIKIATPNGSVKASITGAVTLNNDNSQYGSAGNTLTFQVSPGATLLGGQANAQGVVGGTAIAPAGIVVQNGGTLAIANPAAINGEVTILPGGLFTQSQSTLTGTGTFAHSNGSILNLTNTAAVSGASQALGTVPGTIVRLAVTGLLPGTTAGGVTQFDSRLNDAAVYEVTANSITMGAASVATDALFTLNTNAGIGGVLTNDASGSRTLAGTTGLIAIGSGGATFAATNATGFGVNEDFALGANTLTIGSTQSYDGNPKSGTVNFGATAGANTGSAGSVISVLSRASLALSAADQIPDATRLTMNSNSTFNFNSRSDSIESLTGGGMMTNTGTGATLTVSTTTNDADFSGRLTATTPANLALTKTNSGTQTLSGNSSNTYTGTTTIGGGTLVIGKTATVAIAGDITLGDGATTPGLDILQLSGTGGNQIANTSILTLNGTATNAGTFLMNARSETIGGLVSAAGAGLVENGTAGNSTLTLDVNTTDRSFAGSLQNGAAGTLALTKTGTATQTLTGVNTYTGNTAVSQGRLALSGGGSFANSPDIAVASGAFLDVTAVTSGANWDGIRFAVVNGQTLHGTGTVLGDLDVSTGGTIAPGNSIGTLAVAGLSLTSATSHFALEIDLGLTPAADLLDVTGGITLNGSTLDLSLFNLSPMSVPATFLFAANDLADAVNGTFGTITGVPEGYSAMVDYAFLGTDTLGRIGYGNSLALRLFAVVPEPGTAVWGLAMSLLPCGRRRRTPVGNSPLPRC